MKYPVTSRVQIRQEDMGSVSYLYIQCVTSYFMHAAHNRISWTLFVLIGGALLTLAFAIWWSFDICYLGTCYSKSLPHVNHFVGREEDIRNITGYLDFTSSDIQVVHIVGPPGFGKSTLVKQIGHIFVRRINVHYVDVRGITDIDTLAEKVMLSIVDSIKNTVTFSRLTKWLHKQYTSTLIILDNCDEILESNKNVFLEAIRSLLASPRKSVKYVLTSQKWVADIGNFRLHPIYNLSDEASFQLLDRVAPSLMDDQKKQIAILTGNVPLALDVVGAIFKFPDAPTAEEVILGLKKNLVNTLSPSKLHSTVDVSIGLAYSYLTPELKQLCVNLSHFPGTFNRYLAFNIFGIDDGFAGLDILVQRSLLQFNSASKRYYFHQLLRTYFLQVSSQYSEDSQQQFEKRFLLHFTHLLDYATHHINTLHILDDEKHNFHYMFTLFKTAKHVPLLCVQVALHAVKLNLLHHPTKELYMNMFTALKSTEAASSKQYLITYIEVAILVASQQPTLDAIETLSSTQRNVDKGYQRGIVSVDTFIYFVSNLLQSEWR